MSLLRFALQDNAIEYLAGRYYNLAVRSFTTDVYALTGEGALALH